MLLKGHKFTNRQKQVMQGMVSMPDIWCDATKLPGSLKKTYLSLFDCGAIRPESKTRFVLTAWGKEMVKSFRP